MQTAIRNHNRNFKRTVSTSSTSSHVLLRIHRHTPSWRTLDFEDVDVAINIQIPVSEFEFEA